MQAKNKTTRTDGDIESFLHTVENPQRQKDALFIFNLLNKLLPDQPKMWGTSIIGYGNYHYKYESGREGDFFKAGFSPRKHSLTIYIMPGFKRYESLMSNLGKHTTGKSCLYIKKLDDIDIQVLEELIMASYAHMTTKYG